MRTTAGVTNIQLDEDDFKQLVRSNALASESWCIHLAASPKQMKEIVDEYIIDMRKLSTYMTGVVDKCLAEIEDAKPKLYGWGWRDGEGQDAGNLWIEIGELDNEGCIVDELAVLMLRKAEQSEKKFPGIKNMREAQATLIVRALKSIGFNDVETQYQDEIFWFTAGSTDIAKLLHFLRTPRSPTAGPIMGADLESGVTVYDYQGWLSALSGLHVKPTQAFPDLEHWIPYLKAEVKDLSHRRSRVRCDFFCEISEDLTEDLPYVVDDTNAVPFFEGWVSEFVIDVCRGIGRNLHTDYLSYFGEEALIQYAKDNELLFARDGRVYRIDDCDDTSPEPEPVVIAYSAEVDRIFRRPIVKHTETAPC